VSLPWIAYADLKGLGNIQYTENAVSTGEVKWIRLLEDIPNCLYRNKNSGYSEWDMTFREWWQSVNSETIVTAEFAIDDPLPGIYSGYKFAQSCAGSLKRTIEGQIG
jgi:hypothetical protein